MLPSCSDNPRAVNTDSKLGTAMATKLAQALDAALQELDAAKLAASREAAACATLEANLAAARAAAAAKHMDLEKAETEVKRLTAAKQEFTDLHRSWQAAADKLDAFVQRMPAVAPALANVPAPSNVSTTTALAATAATSTASIATFASSGALVPFTAPIAPTSSWGTLLPSGPAASVACGTGTGAEMQATITAAAQPAAAVVTQSASTQHVATHDDLFSSPLVLASSSRRDDDDDNHDDHDDHGYIKLDAASMVDEVAPSRQLGTSHGCSGGTDSDDSKPGAKKRKRGPTKERVIVKPASECSSAGHRLMGSLPNKITDDDHELSHYDSDQHRNRWFNEVVKGFAGDDLTNPTETDTNKVTAHCFVLMFRSGYQIGPTGSSSLTKHYKRIRALMTIERGLSGKAQFKADCVPLARQVAIRVATEDAAKNPKLRTPIDIIIKNYMSAFNCYCTLLRKEQAGEISASLP